MTTTTPIPPFPIQHSNSSNTITSFNGPEVNRTRVPNPFTGVFVDRETFQVSDPSDGEDDEEDEDDLYHVDSAIFENVSIFPRSRSVTPEAQTQPLRLPVRKETPPFTAAQQIQVPPAIRISLATLGSSIDLAGRASAETTSSTSSSARIDSVTGPTESRAMFPQPAYPEVRSNRGMPPPLVGSTLSSSSTKRQASLPVAVARPSDIESGALPQKKHNITRIIFFLGFVFPLLWLVGACLIWRHTDYAHSNLSVPPPPAPASRSGSNSSNEKLVQQNTAAPGPKPTSTIAPQLNRPGIKTKKNPKGLSISSIGSLRREVDSIPSVIPVNGSAPCTEKFFARMSLSPKAKTPVKPTMARIASTVSEKTVASVSVHRPHHDDLWAWACLWAFSIACVACSVTLLALYANNKL